MPYIKLDRRQKLDPLIEPIQKQLVELENNPGDYNYVISRILGAMWNSKPRYVTICLIMGTLLCVAVEFYRRVAGHYENKAIKNNGDLNEFRCD